MKRFDNESRVRMDIFFILDIFNSPKKVLLVCGVSLFMALAANGSLFELWKLHGEREKIFLKIEKAKRQIQDLSQELRLAQDPEFIKRQARDRFNMVGKDDLLFLFPSES